MATLQDVRVGGDSWTKVLSEEGFAMCREPMMVAFGAFAPSSSIKGIYVQPHISVNILTDGLWAKNCSNMGDISVTPTTKA